MPAGDTPQLDGKVYFVSSYLPEVGTSFAHVTLLCAKISKGSIGRQLRSIFLGEPVLFAKKFFKPARAANANKLNFCPQAPFPSD